MLDQKEKLEILNRSVSGIFLRQKLLKYAQETLDLRNTCIENLQRIDNENLGISLINKSTKDHENENTKKIKEIDNKFFVYDYRKLAKEVCLSIKDKRNPIVNSFEKLQKLHDALGGDSVFSDYYQKTLVFEDLNSSKGFLEDYHQKIAADLLRSTHPLVISKIHLSRAIEISSELFPSEENLLKMSKENIFIYKIPNVMIEQKISLAEVRKAINDYLKALEVYGDETLSKDTIKEQIELNWSIGYLELLLGESVKGLKYFKDALFCLLLPLKNRINFRFDELLQAKLAYMKFLMDRLLV